MWIQQKLINRWQQKIIMKQNCVFIWTFTILQLSANERKRIRYNSSHHKHISIFHTFIKYILLLIICIYLSIYIYILSRMVQQWYSISIILCTLRQIYINWERMTMSRRYPTPGLLQHRARASALKQYLHSEPVVQWFAMDGKDYPPQAFLSRDIPSSVCTVLGSKQEII